MSHPKNKNLKQGLAAAVAAVLLLGGAGSLAYWQDQVNSSGAAITSGSMKCAVSDPGQWTLDGGQAYDAASDKLVPGDDLYKDTIVAVSGEGTHLTGYVTAANPKLTGDKALTDELALNLSYSVSRDGGTTWNQHRLLRRQRQCGRGPGRQDLPLQLRQLLRDGEVPPVTPASGSSRRTGRVSHRDGGQCNLPALCPRRRPDGRRE